MKKPCNVVQSANSRGLSRSCLNTIQGKSWWSHLVGFLIAYRDQFTLAREARQVSPAPDPVTSLISLSNLVLLRCALVLFALGWLGSLAGATDAVLHPAYITGTVHFSNSNPEILSRLSGARTALFWGSSATPPLSFEAREDIPAGSPDFTYHLTVEGAPTGAPAGYVYSFGPRLLLPQSYWPHSLVSPPLYQDQTATVDLNESPGMLDIRFVTSPGGSPVSVTKASYFVTDSGAGGAHAIAYNVPGTGCKLLVHSGSGLHLQVGYSRGTDPTFELINYYDDQNITTALTPDEIRVVEIVVPADTAKGNITGIVDMMHETEDPQDGPGYARNTVMVADGAPSGDDFAQNGRYTFLSGTPASGPYVLTNLLASEDFGPIFGTVPYRVYGRMQFRTGHARNCFRIPSLLGASRPLVPRGGTVDLGNTFVMDPGYVSGQIVLRGPVESGGVRSPLRYVRTASDMGSGAWVTGLYTSVEGRGTSSVATGATESTYEGVGVAEIDGSFEDSRFLGNYSLVLAGLKGQPGIWDLSRFNLYFNSVGTGDPYVAGKLLVTDRRPSLATVHPEEHLTRDLRLCFGTLTVNFTAPAGTTFFRPAVAVRGHFAGPDDLGNPVDYDVATGAGMDLGTGVPLPFLGTPTTATASARAGVVRLALPQGDYTLTPSVQVVAADGSISTLTLPALTYTALCEGDGTMDPCLQVNLPAAPTCASAPSVRISGTVASCTNVAKIVWDMGDNIEHLICEGCGVNPSFSFDFPVGGSCQDYSLKVTASDVAGRTSSQTMLIPADRIAPTITCPSNLTITCASPNGAKVDFPAPVVSDNCDPAPTLVCVPASGTWFLPGTTTVTCSATDHCGNSNSCSFTVTVTTNCPPQPCLDFHCWTNMTVTLPCGSNCVPVYYWPRAQNLCDATNIWTDTEPPSGTCFAAGNHTVDFWATTGTESNHCSFTVTVLPDPNCPTNSCLKPHCWTNMTITLPCGSNCVPVYYSPWAENTCNPADLSSSTFPISGTCFGVGTHNVDFTYWSSTETKHCSFTVTVLDNQNCPPPLTNCLDLHCSTNLIAYTCGSNCVPVSYSVWAQNLCNPSDIYVTTYPPSGSPFCLGTTTVDAWAYGSGKTNHCSFTVTVLPDPNCQPPCTTCTNCSTNVMINGSFETPGIPDGYVALAAGDMIIPGWTTSLNGVEWFNPTVAPLNVNSGVPNDGNYMVELTPAGSVGGGIQQTFATLPDHTYRVSFAMGTSKERGRNGTASMTATVAGEAHAFNIRTENPTITWERKEFSFHTGPTTTVATLNFSSMDDPATSFVNLDDVKVSDCCEDSGLKIYPTMTVEWTCGILQSAPEVSGPYTDVPGATSPHTVRADEPRRFFRTR